MNRGMYLREGFLNLLVCYHLDNFGQGNLLTAHSQARGKRGAVGAAEIGNVGRNGVEAGRGLRCIGVVRGSRRAPTSSKRSSP
jgi:hypothetical protein